MQPPSPLSSRPKRSVVEGSAVSLPDATNLNCLQLIYLETTLTALNQARIRFMYSASTFSASMMGPWNSSCSTKAWRMCPPAAAAAKIGV